MSDSSECLFVLLTRVRSCLKAGKPVLKHCQQVVIEYACGTALYTSCSVLELDAAHVLRAAPLDAVRVGRAARVGIPLVDRGHVGGRARGGGGRGGAAAARGGI